MSSISANSQATPAFRPRILFVVAPLLLVALILSVSPNFRLVSGPDAEPFGGDVIQEWIGGWVLLHGERSRLYDLDHVRSLEHDPALVGFEWDADGYLPMVYPPFWYLLVSPLAMLPFPAAAVVWTLLMAGCLVGTAVVLERWEASNGRDERAGSRVPVAVLAASLFSPLILSLASGQKATLLLLLFTSTFALLDRKRPFAAGLVFGLVAFKPQLTLVVGFVMLLKRQWSFVAGGVVTGGVLVGLSFVAGGDLCRDYFALCAGMGDYVHRGGYDLHAAHSWWGAWQLLLAGWPDSVVKTAAVLSSLATIAVVVRSSWEPFVYGTHQFRLRFSVLVVATLLTSPHLFTYDLTLLLLPMFLVASTSLEEPEALGVHRVGLIAVLVALFAASGFSPRIAEATALQPSVPLAFASLVLIARAATARTSNPVVPSGCFSRRGHRTMTE